MAKWFLKLLGLGLVLLLWSCTGVGPRANISVVQAEVQRTKKIGNVIVANPIGVDPDSNLSRALVAISLRSYGKNATPISEMRPLLRTLNADSLAKNLTVPYQAGFMRVMAKESPRRIKLHKGKKIASVGSAKQIAGRLLKSADQMQILSSAVYSGDNEKAVDAAKNGRSHLQMMSGLNRYVFKKMKAKYVLLTYFKGSEEDYDEGKPLILSAGLVNIRTGKIRYFATVSSTKESLPVPYAAHVGVLGNTLFEQIGEQTPLR